MSLLLLTPLFAAHFSEDFKEQIEIMEDRNRATKARGIELAEKLGELKALRKRVKVEKQSVKLQRKLQEDSTRQRQQQELEEQLEKVSPSNSYEF